MSTFVLLIIAGIITLLSILLKFFKLAKENASIFVAIKNRNDNIMQIISRQQKAEDNKNNPLKHFRLAISDWLSVLSIVAVSCLLLHEYLSIELFALVNVFEIGLMFSLLLFSIIILALSIIERRLGYWIEEFMTIVEHIFFLLESNEKKQDLKPADGLIAHPPAKKKRRNTRTGKK
jgi:hypothetical protein